MVRVPLPERYAVHKLMVSQLRTDRGGKSEKDLFQAAVLLAVLGEKHPGAIADALRRVTAAGIPIDGAADHGVSEAIYLRDPDGNGVELYRDRAEADWPRDAAGQLRMVNAPLDLRALLAEAPPA